MRTLLPLLAAGLLLPAAHAQTVLFNFEGFGGSTEGWEPTQDADSIATNNSQKVEALTQKAIGMGNFIDAFNGTYLLEATPNTPLKARTFRGAKYAWPTAQDWSTTPVLKLAASMNARGPSSERHEYRIRVISGAGAAADTTEMVYQGLKSEGADDNVDNNSFVNDWEVLTFDLSADPTFDLTQIRQIEAAGRNVDDGTNGTPGPDGNWGGLVHLDYVTVEGGGVAVEGAPGLASLGDVYPNPSASGATLAVEVETGQRVAAVVYDALGRSVATAFEGPLAPGATHLVRLDTSDLAPGTYLVQVQGETFAASRRLTVAR